MNATLSARDGSVRRRWRRATLAVCFLVVTATGVAEGTPRSDLVDMPVRFTVANVNRSLVPCPADGRSYVVEGHVVAPRAALRRGAATTLYLHGAAVPEATWHFPSRGHDHARRMARRGHISVTVDRLGYGASSTPNGYFNCLGSQADMAHQIVQHLRNGTYEAPTPVRFGGVALAGHSAGQVIAQIAAYSFGGIDALLVGGWGDPVMTASPAGKLALVPPITVCVSGGEPKRSGGPGGYAFTFEGEASQLLFHDADAHVVDAFIDRHERDPCDAALATGSTINALLVSRVRVPVFLFYGLDDALWPVGTGERQRRLFSGSNDVTLFEVDGTGHMMMLERSAPTFRQAMSSWLTARGF